MNCELSIIVPVYNTAQYLPQCIESAQVCRRFPAPVHQRQGMAVRADGALVLRPAPDHRNPAGRRLQLGPCVHRGRLQPYMGACRGLAAWRVPALGASAERRAGAVAGVLRPADGRVGWRASRSDAVEGAEGWRSGRHGPERRRAAQRGGDNGVLMLIYRNKKYCFHFD